MRKSKKRKPSRKKNGKRVLSSSRAERCLFKAVAVRLHDTGLRGNALLEVFEKIFPHWQEFFDKPLARTPIVQRADKARRYANEAPETHPLVSPYWAVSRSIANERARISKKQLQAVVRGVAA